MTNREYINSLSNESFAHFIYQNAITIGFSYNNSVQGLTEWLSEEQQLTPKTSAIDKKAQEKLLALYEEKVNDGK